MLVKPIKTHKQNAKKIIGTPLVTKILSYSHS